MFSITMEEFLDWEENQWHGGERNRDNADNRYGQKFINDHRNGTSGWEFVHTDTEVFYQENKAIARAAIIRKYVK